MKDKGGILLPKEHFTMSGDIFGLYNWGEGLLLASNG